MKPLKYIVLIKDPEFQARLQSELGSEYFVLVSLDIEKAIEFYPTMPLLTC